MQRPIRVLIVEDNVDIGALLTEFFRDEGLEVSWAQTGRAALELSRSGSFESALVDLSLSDLDGAEVLAGLRKALPGARLAVVTGLAPSAIDAQIAALVDRIFWKPSDPEELLAFARSPG